MQYKLTIQGKLPSLNEYIDACRTNRFVGAKMKKKCQEDIVWVIRGQLPRTIKTPIRITYHWIEGNQKRDLDNICFAKKFINDALVESERIPNDGWKDVRGFIDEFYVDKLNPRIEVILEELE